MDNLLFRFMLSIILSSCIAVRSFKRKSLDRSGALTGFLVMAIHLCAGFRFGVILLVFFFSSSKLTKYGEERKRKLEDDFREADSVIVSISPDVTSMAGCRKIIKELVNLYKESNLGMLNPAYDGRKSLYTAIELPFTSQQFVVNITERDMAKEYKVTIRLAGRDDLHHLQQFLQGRHFETPQDTIQFLDIVLREFPSNNYVTVARSFFSTKFGKVVDIGDGMECWKGYYQSLRPTQMGLSLNIDISATSFYKPLPVVDFAAEYLNLRDVSRPLNDKQRIILKKGLRKLRVEVTHRKDFCRHYAINGITTEPLNQLM